MTYRALHLVFIGMVASVLVACAHTPSSPTLRIDGSTPQRFQASWDRMSASLSSRQQSELSVAILLIALGKHQSLANLPPSTKSGIGPQTVRKRISGMSFKEILALANRQSVKIVKVEHAHAPQ